MLPIYNEFLESIDEKELKTLSSPEIKKIEIVPLAFMRGHTFKNCIVIADELQNASFKQIKNLLTRIGEGGRLIINGDLNQSDLPRDMQGGLREVVNKLKNLEEVGVIRFDREDIVRDPFIAKILDELDKAEADITEPPIKDSWRQYYDPDSED
jgi:phosphate starvation-inducible PhoH-like protein